MPYASNIPVVVTNLLNITSRLTPKIEATIGKLVQAIDRGVHARTPVWSGKAVRNMIWSKDVPNTTQYTEIGTGEPGHTNALPLGAEPRRKANEAAARLTLTALNLKRPFGVYYLSNVAEHIGDLELGLLPEPERSRSPAGMFMVTFVEVVSKLKAGAL